MTVEQGSHGDDAATKLEAELARKAHAGDSRAFGELVLRYQRPVFALCARYLRGADAEDAAQECFVKAFVHLSEFDPSRPLLPWLLTIARRLCVDRLRKHKAEPDSDKAARAIDDGTPTAEAEASAKEQLTLLSRALAALPEGQREALTLFHLEGLPYKEIAGTLGVPLGTVMTWLHRGRAELKAALERGGGELAHRVSPYGVQP